MFKILIITATLLLPSHLLGKDTTPMPPKGDKEQMEEYKRTRPLLPLDKLQKLLDFKISEFYRLLKSQGRNAEARTLSMLPALAVNHLPVMLDRLNVAGACYTPQEGYPAVLLVDSYVFLTLTDDERTVLVLHELGHCILGRDHIDQTVRIDIMNHAVLDQKTITSYGLEKLIKELMDDSRYK